MAFINKDNLHKVSPISNRIRPFEPIVAKLIGYVSKVDALKNIERPVEGNVVTCLENNTNYIYYDSTWNELLDIPQAAPCDGLDQRSIIISGTGYSAL